MTKVYENIQRVGNLVITTTIEQVGDEPVPVPVPVPDPIFNPYRIATVTAEKTAVRIAVGENDAGNPILDIPPVGPDRTVLPKGVTVKVEPDMVRIDGGKAWRLIDLVNGSLGYLEPRHVEVV